MLDDICEAFLKTLSDLLDLVVSEFCLTYSIFHVLISLFIDQQFDIEQINNIGQEVVL